MLQNLRPSYRYPQIAPYFCGIGNTGRGTTNGVTLIELLVTLVFVGVLAALAAPVLNGNFGTRPLDDTTNRLASTLNLLRVKATSQTTAYRFRQGASSNVFLVEYSSGTVATDPNSGRCNATIWSNDNSFTLEDRTLAKNVSFSSITPNPMITPSSVCFDNRGQADRSLDIRLASSSASGTRRIQVFEGGAIQIY